MECTSCGREFTPVVRFQEEICSECRRTADEDSRLPSEEPLRHLEEDNIEGCRKV
jgi:hypothetical protein